MVLALLPHSHSDALHLSHRAVGPTVLFLPPEPSLLLLLLLLGELSLTDLVGASVLDQSDQPEDEE